MPEVNTEGLGVVVDTGKINDVCKGEKALWAYEIFVSFLDSLLTDLFCIFPPATLYR